MGINLRARKYTNVIKTVFLTLSILFIIIVRCRLTALINTHLFMLTKSFEYTAKSNSVCFEFYGFMILLDPNTANFEVYQKTSKQTSKIPSIYCKIIGDSILIPDQASLEPVEYKRIEPSPVTWDLPPFIDGVLARLGAERDKRHSDTNYTSNNPDHTKDEIAKMTIECLKSSARFDALKNYCPIAKACKESIVYPDESTIVKA